MEPISDSAGIDREAPFVVPTANATIHVQRSDVDPIVAGVRTRDMTSRTIAVDGLMRRRAPLVPERLLDVAVVDDEGRVMVPMLDLFAMVRLDASAELVVVHFGTGASQVFRIAELAREDVWLQLDLRERGQTGDVEIVPRLWSTASGSSEPIVSFVAITFASFVGQS